MHSRFSMCYCISEAMPGSFATSQCLLFRVVSSQWHLKHFCCVVTSILRSVQSLQHFYWHFEPIFCAQLFFCMIPETKLFSLCSRKQLLQWAFNNLHCCCFQLLSLTDGQGYKASKPNDDRFSVSFMQIRKLHGVSFFSMIHEHQQSWSFLAGNNIYVRFHRRCKASCQLSNTQQPFTGSFICDKQRNM